MPTGQRVVPTETKPESRGLLGAGKVIVLHQPGSDMTADKLCKYTTLKCSRAMDCNSHGKGKCVDAEKNATPEDGQELSKDEQLRLYRLREIAYGLAKEFQKDLEQISCEEPHTFFAHFYEMANRMFGFKIRLHLIDRNSLKDILDPNVQILTTVFYEALEKYGQKHETESKKWIRKLEDPSIKDQKCREIFDIEIQDAFKPGEKVVVWQMEFRRSLEYRKLINLSEAHEMIVRSVLIYMDRVKNFINQEKLKQLAEENRKLALSRWTDHTGFNIRQVFFEQLEVADTSNGCFIFLDIDHFKKVNDTYGHPGGDKALRYVHWVVSNALESVPDAIYGKLGGDEFVIYVPGYTQEQARNLAEMMREELSNGECKSGNRTIKITSTFWVYAIEPGTNLDTWLERTDMALYAAKHNGKNRVEVYRSKIDTSADPDYKSEVRKVSEQGEAKTNPVQERRESGKRNK